MDKELERMDISRKIEKMKEEMKALDAYAMASISGIRSKDCKVNSKEAAQMAMEDAVTMLGIRRSYQRAIRDDWFQQITRIERQEQPK